MQCFRLSFPKETFIAVRAICSEAAAGSGWSQNRLDRGGQALFTTGCLWVCRQSLGNYKTKTKEWKLQLTTEEGGWWVWIRFDRIIGDRQEPHHSLLSLHEHPATLLSLNLCLRLITIFALNYHSTSAHCYVIMSFPILPFTNFFHLIFTRLASPCCGLQPQEYGHTMLVIIFSTVKYAQCHNLGGY